MTSRTLRTVFTIALASFGFMALRFLLVPVRIKLLTSLLDKEEYGTLTLISLSVSFLAVLLALGSLEFLLGKCPGRPERFQYGALAAAMRLGAGAAALLALPLMLVLMLWQPAKLNLGAADYLIAGGLVLLTLLIVQRVFFLLGLQRILVVRLSQLLYADAWFLPIIPLWFFGTLSIRAVLWVWLGWMLVTAALTHRWAGIGKLWTITIEHVPVRTILAFGMPLLPMTLGHWLFKILDRYVLVWKQDAVAVGNYSLCLNIAMVGYLAGMSLVEIFAAEFFRRVNAAAAEPGGDLAARTDVRDMLQLMLRYGLIVTLPVAAALTQCGESVILLLSNEQYLDAVPILVWTAPAAVLFLFYFVLSRMLLALNRNLQLGVATLAGALLNGVLNVLLVPQFSERGAAVATVISLLLLCIALAWIVRLHRWVALSSLRPIRLAALYVACAAGLYLIQQHFAGHHVAILSLGALWCLAVPFGLGLVRRADFALMRECVESRPPAGEESR